MRYSQAQEPECAIVDGIKGIKSEIGTIADFFSGSLLAINCSLKKRLWQSLTSLRYKGAMCRTRSDCPKFRLGTPQHCDGTCSTGGRDNVFQ